MVYEIPKKRYMYIQILTLESIRSIYFYETKLSKTIKLFYEHYINNNVNG